MSPGARASTAGEASAARRACSRGGRSPSPQPERMWQSPPDSSGWWRAGPRPAAGLRAHDINHSLRPFSSRATPNFTDTFHVYRGSNYLPRLGRNQSPQPRS